MTEASIPGRSQPDLPVACTLGPETGEARMRRWRHLAETAGPVALRSGNTLDVCYEPRPGVSDELEALATAEQQCCAFLDWSVVQRDGRPVLRIVADPGSPDDLLHISSLFGAA